MSSGSSVPYRLRPNKAVDRELFLSLLTRLTPQLSLENYHYIGLGGPFLEDFRLAHARVGIGTMTCIESNEEVHKRQIFNRPVPSIKCVHNTLEEYLDENALESPTIIWFDYTEPKIATQIRRFAQTVGVVPIGSILRITLNANPGSLGTPKHDEISPDTGEPLSPDPNRKPTMQEWRLARLKDRLGTIFPSGLSADGLTQRNFGKTLLQALKISVAREALSFRDRRIIWAFATHYKDGQAMVTATLIVGAAHDTAIETTINNWEFRSTIENPHCLDLPALSTLERLMMESNDNAEQHLNFKLPSSEMEEDPFSAFRKFYRVYPHFSRIEL